MKPIEAWEFAASWGSYMNDGDPGACMYGFSEDCRPQSEEHRQACVDYMKLNRMQVEAHPHNFEDDELDQIDVFVAYIKQAPLA